VLDTGLGNPISLCCLYRLLGQRFGLEIEGCNFPGHFLSRVTYRDKTWLVDCFNRGRFMLAADVAKASSRRESRHGRPHPRTRHRRGHAAAHPAQSRRGHERLGNLTNASSCAAWR
jgi:hypothetical protein